MKVLKRTGFCNIKRKINNDKYIKETRDVMYKHIKNNAKDYLILSIIFIIGIMLGTLLINNSNENSKDDINGYITGFIETVKSENYEIDKINLIKNSILDNLKLLLIIWIAGTTIIGIPLLYIFIIYKGIRIGYTISAIILNLGSMKGLLFSIIAMFLQNVIIIPIIFMAGVSSLRLYRSLVGNYKNIKQEFIRHTLLCAILIVPVIIAALLSSFISSSLIVYFSKVLTN